MSLVLILPEDSHVRELTEIVTVEEDEGLTIHYPRHWPALVEVATKDGRVFKKLTVVADGDPDASFDWDRVAAKFRRLAVPVIGLALGLSKLSGLIPGCRQLLVWMRRTSSGPSSAVKERPPSSIDSSPSAGQIIR